jgi:hypothetical protein
MSAPRTARTSATCTQDIAALDAIRSQKTLSLSLKVREAERERQDASGSRARTPGGPRTACSR